MEKRKEEIRRLLKYILLKWIAKHDMKVRDKKEEIKNEIKN